MADDSKQEPNRDEKTPPAAGTGSPKREESHLEPEAAPPPFDGDIFAAPFAQEPEHEDVFASLAEFMPEDKVSGIADAVEELLELHPSSWSLVRQTTETILGLAELGHVILVGRGANVITARLSHVFHVRLVGSLDQRAVRVQEHYRLGRRAALAFLRREDAGRARYLRKYFKKDVDDPLLYHLTINTDNVSMEEAAEMIGSAVLRRPEEE